MTPAYGLVTGAGPDQQRDRHRGQHQAGQVHVTLGAAQPGEANRERQRQQEADQHLHAEAGHPQFLNQLDQVAVIALCPGLGALASTPPELVLGPAQARITSHFAPRLAVAQHAVLAPHAPGSAGTLWPRARGRAAPDQEGGPPRAVRGGGSGQLSRRPRRGR